MFDDWIESGRTLDAAGLEEYFNGIADARYVARRVFRIVDEQAKGAGLEPLQHQALIQIFGSHGRLLRVNDVADRLDLAPALASRLIKGLVDKGLVQRTQSQTDRRSVEVAVTDAGIEMLRSIDEAVHFHVAYFRDQLEPSQRIMALRIFAFYVGVTVSDMAVKDVTRSP